MNNTNSTKHNQITVVIALLLITLLFTGCFYNIPPSVASVRQKFEDNQKQIQTIVTFLIESEYDTIYIFDPDGTMFADMSWREISNTDASNAIKHLFDRDICLRISKEGNTINFDQWIGHSDIGCGIAYSINGIDLPNIQFMTELVPITEDGWYYYVDDYNEWRVGKRP